MSIDLPSRAAIVATAQESIAKGSKSFSAASRLFDRRTRERAWLLYAWCRRCDDIADGQEHGHDISAVENPAERLSEISGKTETALSGEIVGDPAFDALRIFAAETDLPPTLARDLIAGFALDAEGWRPRTEDDLYLYCYHVAGCVGVMMAIVMGVDPNDRATLDRASDLGIAFQLNNIARDIVDDAMAGRRYIPDDWLADVGLDQSSFAFPKNRRQLARLATRLVDVAETYEESARYGTPALGNRAAWAVLAAARIYGGIGRKVRDAGAPGLDTRMSTTMPEKFRALGVSWLESFSRRRRWPAPGPSRDGLWTMP